MNITKSKWHDLERIHLFLTMLALALSASTYFCVQGTQSMNANDWGELSVVSLQDESAELVAAARDFVELLAKKDFAAAVSHFDDTMKTAMGYEVMRSA